MQMMMLMMLMMLMLTAVAHSIQMALTAGSGCVPILMQAKHKAPLA
jgi:hypothetical protein